MIKLTLERLRRLVCATAVCALAVGVALGRDIPTAAVASEDEKGVVETDESVETVPLAIESQRVTILYLGETGDRPGTEALLRDLVADLRRLDAASDVKCRRMIYSPYSISAQGDEIVGKATYANLLGALAELKDVSGKQNELRLFLVAPVERKDNHWALKGNDDVLWLEIKKAILSMKETNADSGVCDLSNFSRVFAVVDLMTSEPSLELFSKLEPECDKSDEGTSLGYVCLDSLAPKNYLTVVRNCLEMRSAQLKALSPEEGVLTLFDAADYIAKNGSAAAATTLKSAMSGDAQLVLFGSNYPIVSAVQRLDSNAPKSPAFMDMPRPPFNL